VASGAGVILATGVIGHSCGKGKNLVLVEQDMVLV
jgi:hypothetical protein